MQNVNQSFFIWIVFCKSQSVGLPSFSLASVNLGNIFAVPKWFVSNKIPIHIVGPMNFERLNIYRFVLYCFGLGIFLLKHFPVLKIYCVYFLSKLHKNTTCTFTSLSMHSQKFFSKVPLLNHHLYTSAIFKSREVKFKPYRGNLTPAIKVI